ncbi:MAG: NADH:ubiquinone reductase (Na(+)-transporting) subunit A, partial [Gammaproteobacteria bacterium]|nr:NADH:ubiquinone reductase (Na(+)-transporting) subunit A [Gammaproteobacteria bacterium]
MKIKNGLDLMLSTEADSAIAGVKSCNSSAVLGRDFPGTRFDVLVDEGDSVKAGEAVLRDRRQPDILFTSPVSGTIAALRRGARRALVSLKITHDGADNALQFDIPEKPDRDDVRRLMLQSGLWTALRSRPFGHVPYPDTQPKALLITAIDTQPLAPDPAVVISNFSNEFTLGVNALNILVNTPVYLCKSAAAKIDLNGSQSAIVAEFDGPHPAGLPGTHIHALCPITFDGKAVWHIGYQDVISLGHLMQTGKLWFDRVISLAGAAVKNPRLLTVPLGAAIDDVVAGELSDEPVRIVSGSPFSGHTAVADEAYLGQRHNQVTAIFEAKSKKKNGSRKSLFDTALGGEAGPLVPVSGLDQVAPPGVLAVPL